MAVLLHFVGARLLGVLAWLIMFVRITVAVNVISLVLDRALAFPLLPRNGASHFLLVLMMLLTLIWRVVLLVPLVADARRRKELLRDVSMRCMRVPV